MIFLPLEKSLTKNARKSDPYPVFEYIKSYLCHQCDPDTSLAYALTFSEYEVLVSTCNINLKGPIKFSSSKLQYCKSSLLASIKNPRKGGDNVFLIIS